MHTRILQSYHTDFRQRRLEANESLNQIFFPSSPPQRALKARSDHKYEGWKKYVQLDVI